MEHSRHARQPPREHFGIDLVDGPGASEDVDLVTMARAGDRAGFAELYRRHRELVWCVARACTLSDDEAAGATVDTFVRLLHEGARPEAASFRAQVAETAHAAATERQRRRRGAGTGEPGTPDRVDVVDTDASGSSDDEVSRRLRERLPTTIPAPPPELWALAQVAWEDTVAHRLGRKTL